MRYIYILCLMTLGGTHSIYAQKNKEYAATLNRLLEITGTTKSTDVMIDRMIDIAKLESPEYDDTHWETIRKVFEEGRPKYREEKLMPIYQKYLTVDDMLAIIQFYETPVGMKYAQKMPLLTLEAQEAALAWVNELVKDIEKELRRKN